jgi:hypothetical protein
MLYILVQTCLSSGDALLFRSIFIQIPSTILLLRPYGWHMVVYIVLIDFGLVYTYIWLDALEQLDQTATAVFPRMACHWVAKSPHFTL